MSGRALSVATAAKIAEHHTKPGFLVQITFASQIVRLSSAAEQNWNAAIWVKAGLDVSGVDAAGRQGTVKLWDYDASFRTMVLTDGVADRRISIWKFYEGAVDAGDPVLIFDGVGDRCEIREGKVTVTLAKSGSGVMLTPRRRIGPASGFNFLLPTGTLIPWGDRVLKLERRGG